MTQHIRERSRKPSTPLVQDRAGALASPSLTLKHKTLRPDPSTYQPYNLLTKKRDAMMEHELR